jgi:hypothetical protein
MTYDHTELKKKFAERVLAGDPWGEIARFRRSENSSWTLGSPGWNTLIEYDVCIARVQDKPVFEKDKLYHPDFGLVEVEASSVNGYLRALFNGARPISEWSWNPPKKRILMLNGKELPAPDGERGDYCVCDAYYKSASDMDKVYAAINAWLSGRE